MHWIKTEYALASRRGEGDSWCSGVIRTLTQSSNIELRKVRRPLNADDEQEAELLFQDLLKMSRKATGRREVPAEGIDLIELLGGPEDKQKRVAALRTTKSLPEPTRQMLTHILSKRMQRADQTVAQQELLEKRQSRVAEEAEAISASLEKKAKTAEGLRKQLTGVARDPPVESEAAKAERGRKRYAEWTKRALKGTKAIEDAHNEYMGKRMNEAEVLNDIDTVFSFVLQRHTDSPAGKDGEPLMRSSDFVAVNGSTTPEGERCLGAFKALDAESEPPIMIMDRAQWTAFWQGIHKELDEQGEEESEGDKKGLDSGQKASQTLREAFKGLHQSAYDADKLEGEADHHFVSSNILRARIKKTTSAAANALKKAKTIGHRETVDLLSTADIASRAMGMTLPGRHLRGGKGSAPGMVGGEAEHADCLSEGGSADGSLAD